MDENETLTELTSEQVVMPETLVEEKENPLAKLPEKAVRNYAAQAAVLTKDPAKMVEDYQAMIAEISAGSDMTANRILVEANQTYKNSSREGMMSILADPKLSVEEKQKYLAAYNSPTEPSQMIAMFAASAPENSTSAERQDVRIFGAEQFRAYDNYARGVQQLKNQQSLLNAPEGVKLIGDFLGMLIPFSDSVHGAKAMDNVRKKLEGNSNMAYGGILLGEITNDMVKALQKMPIDKRLEMQTLIAPILREDSGIIPATRNELRAFIDAQSLLDGNYSTADRFFDNFGSILDTVGLGAVVRVPYRAAKNAIAVRKAAMRTVSDTTSPVSPVEIMKETNQEKARSTYQLAVSAEGDELSQAVSGTSKIDLVAANNLPQAAVDKTVKSKIIDPERKATTTDIIEADQNVVNAVRNDTGVRFTDAEIKSANSHIMNDLKDSLGITWHDNMLSVAMDGDRVLVRGLMGNKDGGFQFPQDALDHAKLALRKYGVTDKQLTLMTKEGGEYVPFEGQINKNSLYQQLKQAEGQGDDFTLGARMRVTSKEPVTEGDFMVQVEFDHTLNAKDVQEWDKLDVKRNFFDRVPALSFESGSAARHVLDAASMLHPSVTGPAVVAIDKSARVAKALLQMHDSFVDGFRGLPKDRQSKMSEYIQDANANGIRFDPIALNGKGFTPEEIDLLRDFKKGQDTHFFVENANYGRNLRNQYYEIYDDSINGSKFIAKPISKDSTIQNVFDPVSGQRVAIDSAYSDALYNGGGSYAKLRRPVEINGDKFEYIVSRNNAQGYLRAITDNDQVLNYRHGYYQVRYNAPRFVTQVIRDANGKELYTKAVATANDTREGEHIAARLAQQSGVSIDDFKVRDDVNQLRPDSDYSFDLDSASGRIAQRYRGKRLEDSTTPLHGFSNQHVVDPVEASVRAANSIASRVSTRDTIEVLKERVVHQFPDYFPKNEFGQPQWPNSIRGLDYRNVSTKYDKEAADLRTHVEYINYLENGYINSLDDATKGVFNAVSHFLKNLGSSKGEKLAAQAAASNITPSNLGKMAVFNAYIGLNPFRQWIVQSHQAIRLMAYNPSYMVQLPKDVVAYLSKSDPEIVKFIDDSGALDAVDKSNLVRNSLLELKDTASTAKQVVGQALSVPRKYGFDLGEKGNLLAHLLSVRDKYRSAGENVSDARVKGKIYSEARALSYDMNYAGDMPYNQNFMSIMLQFMQVPHKAVAQVANRRLSVADKSKLMALDLALWGVPFGAGVAAFLPEDMQPETQEAREVFFFGLESYAYNKALTNIFGTEVSIDYSSLAPYGADGFAKLYENIASEGMIGVFTSSPAFTLLGKEGGRFREAITRTNRYLFGDLGAEDGLPPETAAGVLKSVLEISSGWSNAAKAGIIVEMGKLPNAKTHEPLMNDEKWLYAAAQLFGFKSQKEMLEFKASDEMRKGKKEAEEDWEQQFKSYLRIVKREGVSLDDESAIRVQGALRMKFESDPMAMQYFNKRLSQEMRSNQDTITRKALEYGNLAKPGGALQHLKNLNMADPTGDYTRMNKLIEDAQREFKE